MVKTGHPRLRGVRTGRVVAEVEWDARGRPHPPMVAGVARSIVEGTPIVGRPEPARRRRRVVVRSCLTPLVTMIRICRMMSARGTWIAAPEPICAL